MTTYVVVHTDGYNSSDVELIAAFDNETEAYSFARRKNSARGKDYANFAVQEVPTGVTLQMELLELLERGSVGKGAVWDAEMFFDWLMENRISVCQLLEKIDA